jgi:hypothetical protein
MYIIMWESVISASTVFHNLLLHTKQQNKPENLTMQLRVK